MYGIYGNIYHKYTPNVSIYRIHGSYGLWLFCMPSTVFPRIFCNAPTALWRCLIATAAASQGLGLWKRFFEKRWINRMIFCDKQWGFGLFFFGQPHIVIYWLVVWNMASMFHVIYGMSSFPLTFIFFKMVKTTNQCLFWCFFWGGDECLVLLKWGCPGIIRGYVWPMNLQISEVSM